MASKSERHDLKRTTVLPLAAPVLEILQPQIVSRFGESARGVEMNIKRVQKTVYRLRILVDTAEGRRHWVAVAKSARSPRHAQIAFQAQSDLFRSGFDRLAGDGIAVPEPFGVVEDFVLMEFVAGETIRSAFRQKLDLELARKLARGAAKLHRLPAQDDPVSGSGWSFDKRRERIDAFLLKNPALGPKMEHVFGIYTDLEAAWEPFPPSVLHGDYHWSQMLIDEAGTCYLIDITPGWSGDPASDIGTFLAQLEKHREQEWFQAFHDAFLDEYFGLMSTVAVPRILAYQSLALIRLATKYALEDPDEKHLSAAAMVERAEELMLQARAVRRSETPAN